MTLQEVPTDILKESMLALDDLRRKYRGEPMVTAYAGRAENEASCKGCPLCLFVVEVNQYSGTGILGREKCDPCMWRTIEGFGDAHLYACCEGQFDSDPIPERLTRIDRWQAAITAEIASRETPCAG